MKIQNMPFQGNPSPKGCLWHGLGNLKMASGKLNMLFPGNPLDRAK